MGAFLTDLGASDLARLGHAGGKAIALCRMIAAGFPVPGGFVVLSGAFEEGGLGPGAATVVRERLEAWVAEEPAVRFAVRSSGVGEDGAEAAFAGEFATVLNVGLEDVAGAIETVYASRHRAEAYREARGLRGTQAMAVIVQQLVQAECSGVAYSVDPVGPDHARVLVNAAWGLGPGVVEGRVPADTHWLRRHDLAVAEQRIATKDRQVVPDAGGGVVEAPVAAEHQAVPCLPPAWLTRIAQYALALEQHFGSPQDVEWAVAGGQVWVLQSRPLTALPERPRPAPFPIQWENE